ncbi:beta-ketoacyl-ACP synthase III [Neptunomonas sp. XY-337]|uniref:beta-ketoacyl-ACP synthase III n=1 Tax=Neptunomonas sp. XY-337 TaxID=2561897 RepID=UPI0010AAEA4B|nr:beta-ketoacyl-ACP synthase III [Neptunomonas sp. XY-337]
MSVVISGVGVWTPPFSISNTELVDAYNAWATQFNEHNAEQIAQGLCEPKALSSAEFIEKASGIKSRYTYCKEGTLDVNRMRPKIAARSDDQLSHQAEIALDAAKKALSAANKSAQEIDAVIVSCSYTQRAYPAIAIEVQHALGIKGFAFDMLVACSAATFGLHRAYEMIKAETARAVLVVNPELTSPQVNYTDRESHFIFGDVATATVVESKATAHAEHCYEILSTRAETQFSNNIRSNFGYTARVSDTNPFEEAALFHQNGKKVFKEVCPMAAQHLEAHIEQHNLSAHEVDRWWLHQANINMNNLIVKRLLGRDADASKAPIVLDRYANTASAGSLVAFALNHEDLSSGATGVICSFGAGYSIGSLVLRKY